MSRIEMWLLGFTCHFWRNRRMLVWLLLVVPLVTTAALKLMASPEMTKPEVLR